MVGVSSLCSPSDSTGTFLANPSHNWGRFGRLWVPCDLLKA